MPEQLDCVVVGAGVVGLAIGRSLAMAGRDVVVLEREYHIGMHSSSHNSEVIHAGLYYPEESLKASLCVAGKEMMYAYCDAHGIPVKRIGKLVVASVKGEFERLHEIQMRAMRNGVEVQELGSEQVRELEPLVSCERALLSPSTGIVDSHAYMLALRADIESYGGVVLCNSEVADVSVRDDGFIFRIASDEDEDEEFVCKTLVNAAGHGAQVVAGMIAPEGAPTRYLAKGHYFAYQGKSPFSHLIYPIPFDGGLGIHATNDLGGAARFGPDVTWVNEVDYEFDGSRKADFVKAIRRYFPDLDEQKLVPAYTGVRPKIAGPGEATADFSIQGAEEHGVRGLVNLFGIDSPGLTSSLAIGEYVNSLLSH